MRQYGLTGASSSESFGDTADGAASSAASAAPLTDHRAESARESRTRLAILDSRPAEA